MKRLILILAMLPFTSSFAQLKYPTTPAIEVSETIFGTVYKDNYRWLENMKDPKVITWFKEQADLTNSVMNTISGRDELIAEWRKLDALQPSSYFSESEANGRYFFQMSKPGEKISKVYYRETLNGKDILLFDPVTFIPSKNISVQSISPSYDGKKLLIGYSEEGAEISTIRILNVETKKILPDEILNTAGAGNWTFDNKSFFYMWIKSADNKDPESRLNPKYKIHQLGTKVSDDVDYFSNKSYPSLNIPAKSYPYVLLTEDRPDYIFAGYGDVARELTSYYAPITEFNSKNIPWKKLTTADDKIVRNMDFFGDKIYGITYNNAKNYQLVATDLKNPDWKNAEIIAPEREMTLETFARSKDFIMLTYSDGISYHISKYDPKTKQLKDIPLPYPGTLYLQRLALNSNDYIMMLTSWDKPITEYTFNAETEQFSPSAFNKPETYPEPYRDLVIEEVQVKGHDGAMIPLSIIYKKGLKKDGNNTAILNGYGAYGISMSPGFSPKWMSLVVKGAVFAIPHVRGGSEKGEDWYKAGYKLTKPNTWKDFISCAEYLIEQKYTQPSKLAGTGTSAGGILISRAITERPELFAAAVCNVGAANAMRAEFTSNGPANIPEFGTVTDEKESKALFEMDGMMHVKKGVAYPAVLGVAGWNDPRVVAWQPGKLIAALQQATTSSKPVLLKVNYDNGHFTEDKEVTWANFADQLAFLMWQTGHPDFQVKKGQ